MSINFGILPDLPLAACANTKHPNKFFPKDELKITALSRYAVQLCESCIEREPCLQFAIDHDEEHGIWGGLTPKQRKRIVPKTQPLTTAAKHITTVRSLMRNGMTREKACEEVGIAVVTYLTYEARYGHQVSTPTKQHEPIEKDKT